ncbi:MAG: hypothetical protein R3B90_11455 [Planctomycetaceae bacterium]
MVTLKGQLTEQQLQELRGLIEPLTSAVDAELRHKAIETLHVMNASAVDD